ncbi:MAG: acyl-CoA desaturase [Gemmataceae bacterium]|nr:acyl-CoA desaturase [Gemmataceae bacterium]
MTNGSPSSKIASIPNAINALVAPLTTSVTTPAPAAPHSLPPSNPLPKFPKDDGFREDLRKRVDAYFAETGQSPRDLFRMYLKTAIILTWLIASYIFLAYHATHWYEAIPAAISLAMAMSAVGFSIQHDGGHNAYSKRNWVNRLAGMSLDLIGASSYLWKWKHGVYHHTYCNVEGADTDIDLGMLGRVSPHQRHRWWHRWQHIYLFPLYALTASRWHLWGDFKEALTGKMGPHPIPRPKGRHALLFWGAKITSIFTFLILPMLWRQSIWEVVLFYFVVTGIMGVIMTIVFQLAHCVQEADFPAAAPAGEHMDKSWAVPQVETTVNFARGNPFLSWWLGGLNFQIEHHLFPQICHIHYPAISKIVEQVCKEHGVRYTAHPTFWRGLVSHYRWLREMGRPPVSQTA